jgi:hypothetical protein
MGADCRQSALYKYEPTERGCRNRGEPLRVGDVEVVPVGYLDQLERISLRAFRRLRRKQKYLAPKSGRHRAILSQLPARLNLRQGQPHPPVLFSPGRQVGHDAFAVIRETIRNMDMVAIGRVVLTSREHIIGLEPMGKGLLGTLLRYPYEVRDEREYFDEIQDVKVTKDMLDLAKHIVSQKTADFEPERFEDHYEEALTELINAKRQGKTISPRARPSGGNVVDLMDALKKSIASEASAKGKKPRKAAAGQKEMLLPIEGRKPAEKKAAKPERSVRRRKAG